MSRPPIKSYTPPTVYEYRCALIAQRYEMAKARRIEKQPQPATLIQLALPLPELKEIAS